VLGAALGLVSLWGTVVDCAQGWRAEFAYPGRIYVLEPSYGGRRSHVASAGELAADLRSYGVAVETLGCCSSKELELLLRAGADATADRAA
jgi:hypothetical protein